MLKQLIYLFVIMASFLTIDAQTPAQDELQKELDNARATNNYSAQAILLKRGYFLTPENDKNPGYLFRSAENYAKVYAEKTALHMLDTAIELGYTNIYELQSNPAFDFLRHKTEWKLLELKQQKAYKIKEGTFYWGLYYGILTILFLLNLFLFFSLKARSHLYFCLVLITDAQWELTQNLSAKVYFVKLIPWVSYFNATRFPKINMIYTVLFVVCFVFFTKSFLQLKTKFPRLNTFLNLMLGCILLMTLLSWFKIYVPEIIESLTVMITFLTCIFGGIMCWYKGNKEARFFVFAFLALFVGLALPKYPILFVYSILNIGLLLFYSILTIALADKMKIMRLDKEQAQEKALEVLEEKVVERTNEVVEQKKKIEEKNHLIEEKQKEIIDSITYAKRLQEAILPPKAFIDKHLPDNFVLYKPKDIVAGDFYWAEYLNEKFYIAAADSTGHGVPGAMVSVVCSNALNRSVKEFKETETGKILDKTRDLVLQTFEKSTNEVKDGMDISLLCIDFKNKIITWSGANNPLWYIQNEELLEIKADKQPIGKTENPKPFTTHSIPFEKNSFFYLFTDGLADQFGGPNGKKFKYKPFSNLLLNNKDSNLVHQNHVINEVFEAWKGELEQVDDVCVIGIKV